MSRNGVFHVKFKMKCRISAASLHDKHLCCCLVVLRAQASPFSPARLGCWAASTTCRATSHLWWTRASPRRLTATSRKWCTSVRSATKRRWTHWKTGVTVLHRRRAGLWRREERLQLLLLLLFLSALRPPVFLSLWRSVFLFLFWRAVPPTSLTESPGGERPDQRQEKRAGLHAVQLQRDGSRLHRHHIHDFRPLQWPDQQVSARTTPERAPKAIARQLMELSQTQVETSQGTSNCSLPLQHKPDKVYEWVWEELLHMDLLWGIQDLGQDGPGEDVWKKQWRCGVPAGGTLVQWSPGWIFLSSGLPESSSVVRCARCVQPKHTSFMWTCKAWIQWFVLHFVFSPLWWNSTTRGLNPRETISSSLQCLNGEILTYRKSNW